MPASGCKAFLTFAALIAVLAVSQCGVMVWQYHHVFQEQAQEKAGLLAQSAAQEARLPLFADDRETLKRLASALVTTSGAASVTIVTAQGEVVAQVGRTGLPPERTVTAEAPVMAGTPLQDAVLFQDARTGNDLLGKVQVTLAGNNLREGLGFTIVVAVITVLLEWLALWFWWRQTRSVSE